MLWFTYRVCATTSILRTLVNFPRSRLKEVIYGFVDFVRLVEFFRPLQILCILVSRVPLHPFHDSAIKNRIVNMCANQAGIGQISACKIRIA